jgi:phage terminase small subunit
MTPLSNPKHEQFAIAVAEGKTHREAAQIAGYASQAASTLGARLAGNPKVRKRIREIQNEAAGPIVLTGESGVERGLAQLLRKLKDRAASHLFESVPVLDENGTALGVYIPLQPGLFPAHV